MLVKITLDFFGVLNRLGQRHGEAQGGAISANLPKLLAESEWFNVIGCFETKSNPLVGRKGFWTQQFRAVECQEKAEAAATLYFFHRICCCWCNQTDRHNRGKKLGYHSLISFGVSLVEFLSLGNLAFTAGMEHV